MKKTKSIRRNDSTFAGTLMANVIKGKRIWMRIEIDGEVVYIGDYNPKFELPELQSDPDRVAARLFEEMMKDSDIKVERLNGDGLYALTLPADD